MWFHNMVKIGGPHDLKLNHLYDAKVNSQVINVCLKENSVVIIVCSKENRQVINVCLKDVIVHIMKIFLKYHLMDPVYKK